MYFLSKTAIKIHICQEIVLALMSPFFYCRTYLVRIVISENEKNWVGFINTLTFSMGH